MWLIGDGQSLSATKDSWMSKKVDFIVENHWRYEGRDEAVASLFYSGPKRWDSDIVYE